MWVLQQGLGNRFGWKPSTFGNLRGALMISTFFFRFLFAGSLLLAVATLAVAQGETTSAIVGQVTDATTAAIPGAAVTITNRETGLQRSAKTDDEGRFNFPQLKPGTYSVKVEAEGFALQQNDSVFSGLGQKQTVNFTLRVAESKERLDERAPPHLSIPEKQTPSTNSMR